MTTVFERAGKAVSDFATTVGNRVSGAVDQVKSDFNKAFSSPTTSRLSAAGLAPGGIAAKSDVSTNVNIASTNNDWRIKIGLGNSANFFYKSSNPGIMAPLTSTNGVIFPYTPTISVTHTASYSQESPVHSNYPYQFFNSSAVNQIQITGTFTAQTAEEAKYVLASIYFFRSASKMFFGNSDYAGNPPPIVFLNGYGEQYFNNVPCVVQSFTHQLPNDVDYIECVTSTSAGKTADYELSEDDMVSADVVNSYQTSPGGKVTRVPTSSDLTIILMPVYSRKSLSDFSLEKFAAGDLVTKGFI